MSEDRDRMNEKQKDCKHEWFCSKAGMFVSLFECKKCRWETRDPSNYYGDRDG